jgi:UrcA family protein
MNTFTKTFAVLAIALSASAAYAGPRDAPRYADGLSNATGSSSVTGSGLSFVPKESSLAFTLEDISTPEGIATLTKKIRVAANKMCYASDQGGDESLEVASKRKKCFNTAVKTAMASVDQMVAVVAANKNGAVSLAAR